MRAARSRHLSGVYALCLVAVGCSGAEVSKPDDPLLAASGRGAGVASGAGSRAGVPAGPTAGVQSGASAGRGPTTAGTTAPVVGTAGTVAPATAGAAGAPLTGGSAGTATAGGTSYQAGAGGSVAGSAGAPGGAAGAAGADPNDPDDPCSVMAFVDNGVPVTGAGCKQQWEGIVMTQGGRGLCTAAFITERHLISASHCYARDGAVSLNVSAPTWDNGAMHSFQAQVKRSGTSQTLDLSIIDLGKPVEWATPERRFLLHAGKATAVDMHLYGFGSGGSSGAAGKLRGVPNRATIRVTDNGRGTLSGKAGDAQLCTGDSGGPAFVEKTAAVIYGINQAIVPSGTGGGRTCADPDWTIMFTNVSAYMSFIEEALGKMCERLRVDDLDVARCG